MRWIGRSDDRPQDKRNLMSVGPVTLSPGAEEWARIAFIVRLGSALYPRAGGVSFSMC